MDYRYVRYVSVAALLISKERDRFIVGRRVDYDSFKPGELVFPSGRLQKDDKNLLGRLWNEIEDEVPQLGCFYTNEVYCGDCYFLRDGLPVIQLCFAMPLANSSKDRLPTKSHAFKEIFWADISLLQQEYSRTQNSYIQEMIRFCKIAQEKGMLK